MPDPDFSGGDRADGGSGGDFEERQGSQVWLGDQWFTVVGILDRLPLAPEIDRSALVGFPAAIAHLGFDGCPNTIYLRSSPDAVEAVRAVLPATVNPEHPEEVDVGRPSDAPALAGAPRAGGGGRGAGWSVPAMRVAREAPTEALRSA